MIVGDEHAATTEYIPPDFEGDTFSARLTPALEKDGVVVSAGRAAHDALAHANDPIGSLITASQGEHVYEGS